MTEEQRQRHIKAAKAAAKRMATTRNPARTVSTWAKHMKAHILGAK